MTATFKKCSRCSEVKPLTEFYKNMGVCKDCANMNTKKYYKQTKERFFNNHTSDNKNKAWSFKEIKFLKENYKKLGIYQTAVKLKRTPTSVAYAYYKYNKEEIE